ncbi:MAG: PCMD domain-containing protein [Bacteroidales bacterium]|nr:PCMD domain-containing protein [Bacteroidales bacterium]
MRKSSIIFLAICMQALSSCIVNDVPYPNAVANVTAITVRASSTETVTFPVTINSTKHVINVTVPEKEDVARLFVSGMTFEHDFTTCSPQINGKELDLRRPIDLKLSTYPGQSYNWTLSATQNIPRHFTIKGQIGACVIDEANHRVIAYVPTTADLMDLKVTGYKLGPEEISSYSLVNREEASDLMDVTDFSSVVYVDVTAHNRTDRWSIDVLTQEFSIKLTPHVWTRVAHLFAEGVAGETCGFKYRKKGEATWISLSPEDLKVDGGNFSATLNYLEPLTTYEVEAICGEDSVTAEFKTEAEETIPNAGFEVFSPAKSGAYFNWFNPADLLWNTQWWDSGNIASTSVGESGVICSPDTNDKTEGNASARLDSKYVVVKFAAGNLFSGSFYELVGTSGGKVNFGRPFTTRPRKLKLDLKYNCGLIEENCIGGMPPGESIKADDPDRCQIYIALGDWDYKVYGGTPDSPVQVNTTDKSTFFDPQGENVIAYGTFISKKSIPEWTSIEIPLEYTSVTRKPTHIIISCAASMFGDYFTGSPKSTLWIDNMSLEY